MYVAYLKTPELLKIIDIFAHNSKLPSSSILKYTGFPLLNSPSFPVLKSYLLRASVPVKFDTQLPSCSSSIHALEVPSTWKESIFTLTGHNSIALLSLLITAGSLFPRFKMSNLHEQMLMDLVTGCSSPGD